MSSRYVRLAGVRIELVPDVLEDRFFVAEILAGLAIELPQHAVLADREHQLLIAGVDEHALEHDVEIERFAGRVLEVPRRACRCRRSSASVELV